MNIINKTSTHNTSYLANRRLEWIVIHYTAGTQSRPGAAANTANYFANTPVEASADFIVDDISIVQYNPDLKNRYTWHCGGGRQSSYGGSVYQKCTNQNSIGIEICSSNNTGRVPNANDPSWYFTDAAVEQALELTKHLMKLYGIDANHVVRHFDVTGKFCPGIVGWNSATGDETKWLAFKYKLTNNPTIIKEEEEEMTQEKFNEMMDNWIAEQAKKEPSAWSAESREWAEKNGLISGDENGQKMYKKMLTREELITVLYRALHRFFIQ